MLTCFTLACSIQVVVGAQEFALAIGAAVIDAGGQVRAKVHLSCYISTQLKPTEEVFFRLNSVTFIVLS